MGDEGLSCIRLKTEGAIGLFDKAVNGERVNLQLFSFSSVGATPRRQQTLMAAVSSFLFDQKRRPSKLAPEFSSPSLAVA